VRRAPILLALALLAGGCATLPAPDFSPKEPHLSVVTYNINWGCPAPARVIEFLRRADADIVFLQETHRHWEEALRTHLAKSYSHFEFHEGPGAGGIAYLSKYPLKNVKLVKPVAGWFPALRADVETPIGRVQLLNVHLRPPLSNRGSVSLGVFRRIPDIHRRELALFLGHTDPKVPLIVAGDFNENEKGGSLRELLGHGYTDALSGYDTRSRTWIWRTRFGLRLSNRYDHIIYNDHLHCTGAAVPRVRASDHFPVYAVMVTREKKGDK